MLKKMFPTFSKFEDKDIETYLKMYDQNLKEGFLQHNV
jgi:hypothetical protein